MPTAACRLFIIPAQSAPIAAILRRGPTSWFQITKWDMKANTFSPGAWLRGRIYEDKCDVSPDGVLFVYSVYKSVRLREKMAACYTAVSRLPWLTALAIWPQDTTYGGGGRFLDNRRLALRGISSDPYPELPRGLQLANRNWPPLHESTQEISEADWCGYDHKGETIYTRAGLLFRKKGRREQKIADFTDLRPDPQPPPAWAVKPLASSRR